MRTFIYAAGRATRLGPAFADRPKILLEIGEKTLLEWHLQRMAELGLRELVLVTGHKREQVVARLPSLRDRYGVEITELANPNFTEGSVLSFEVSIPEMLRSARPALLMDGDVVYPAELLRRLLGSRHRTALLVDRNFSKEDDDPVLVPLRGGKPFEFMKKWKGTADQVGESIGFFRLDALDVPLVVEETRKRLVGHGRLDSYDEVVRALVVAGRFHAVDVSGLPWTEVDFPKDVDYARSKVLPAILKREAIFSPS
jgi:choline kinase